MTNRQKKIAVGVVIGGLAVWFGSLAVAKVLVPEANPPARYTGTMVNVQVDAVLKRACYDCHSNETKWPWYTKMPLVSVLVAHDVAEGREVLNFSEWASMDVDVRTKALSESAEEVQEGEMPMDIYVRMHPQAQLSEQEKAWLAVFAAETTAESESGGQEGDNQEEDAEDE